MTELLDLAVEAHGGSRRWEQISRFRIRASITGAIWALKGKSGLLDDVTIDGLVGQQYLKIAPFPRAGAYATWDPDRETIESNNGSLLEERRYPAASFAGHTRQTPWDDFHVVYFAAEANWNYAVAPFIFLQSDFVTEETEPWHEDGQVWRSLLVTYPEHVVAHCRQQTYYFDDAGLLRRIDYAVDLLGGGPAVHYPSDYQEFDGIMVPTRRRVYVRNQDGSAARESTSIAIDVTDATFA